MRTAASLAAAMALFAGASLGSSAAPTHHLSAAYRHPSMATLMLQPLHLLRVAMHPMILPMATGTAVSPGPTGTATPTPTATSTYPDPTSLFARVSVAFSAVQRVHFNQIETADKPQVETTSIQTPGDATCKGPAFRTHLIASDVRLDTNQQTKVNRQYIVVKNRAWEKSSRTKHQWRRVTTSNVTNLVTNPLDCGAQTGGTETSTTAIINLSTVGPDMFQGIPVWHVHGTYIDTQSGNTGPVDYYLGQQDYMPYKFTLAYTDVSSNYQVAASLFLTRFNEKLTIKAPRVGSTKP